MSQSSLVRFQKILGRLNSHSRKPVPKQLLGSSVRGLSTEAVKQISVDEPTSWRRLPGSLKHCHPANELQNLATILKGFRGINTNGRRDFEIGKELQVKCSSFSGKGIPVVSLLE